MSRNKADKSGNCPAGFVTNQGVSNPAVHDFYLQLHGGLGMKQASLGTALQDSSSIKE
jgi:eukaryotic translation initiation factor 2C